MTPYNKILSMIEAVDPGDAAKLNEIDEFVRFFLEPEGRPILSDWHFLQYTRSRDALKAIRPDFWAVSIYANMGIPHVFEGAEVISVAEISRSDSEEFKSPELPTEELAELHAIIQAIEHDRNTPPPTSTE